MKSSNKLSIHVKFYCDRGRITKIDLSESKNATKWEIESKDKDPGLEKKINSWMEDYCNCRQPKVLLPLDLDQLPAYTKKVLTFLLDIPLGTTMSYQELAIKTKNPKAARAVGNACGRNPFPLIIPCHRILKSDQGLGGYGLGTPLKIALLNFEGVFP